MTAEDFDQHLARQLCWIDGSPTHASHAGQRQCRHCRRKWSYSTLRKQWELARLYCTGRKRVQAAQRARVDPHMAGRHYRIFEDALAGHFLAAQMERRGPESSLSPIFDVGDSLAHAKDRRLLRHCIAELLADYPLESRLELLYRLVFARRVRRFGVIVIEARANRPRRRGSRTGFARGERGADKKPRPKKAQKRRN